MKIETDELLPCSCGHKPTSFTLTYGREPYILFCSKCKKQNLGGISGNDTNAINYWNNVLRHLAPSTKHEPENKWY